MLFVVFYMNVNLFVSNKSSTVSLALTCPGLPVQVIIIVFR